MNSTKIPTVSQELTDRVISAIKLHNAACLNSSPANVANKVGCSTTSVYNVLNYTPEGQRVTRGIDNGLIFDDQLSPVTKLAELRKSTELNAYESVAQLFDSQKSALDAALQQIANLMDANEKLEDRLADARVAAQDLLRDLG